MAMIYPNFNFFSIALEILFKNFFGVFPVCMYVSEPCDCSASRRHKRASDALELKSQTAALTVWWLQIHPRLSGRAVSILSP